MPVELGTVAPIGFDDFQTDSWLKLMEQLGCTTVQAYRNSSAGLEIGKIRDIVKSFDMPCDSLHGLFGEQHDPSSPDETARRKTVETFKSEGDLALAIGGNLVVVHCSTIREKGIPSEERSFRVSKLKKTIEELGRFGQSANIRYAFENLPAYHPLGWDVAELAGILSDVAAPNTGMCFDTGHANMVGDAPGAVRKTAGQMIYIHLSDNNGKDDEHLMAGEGTLDIKALAEEVAKSGYSGPMMLEVFYSEKQLRALIDEGYAEKLTEIIKIANNKPLKNDIAIQAKKEKL